VAAGPSRAAACNDAVALKRDGFRRAPEPMKELGASRRIWGAAVHT
jgi:hypothetical protein